MKLELRVRKARDVYGKYLSHDQVISCVILKKTVPSNSISSQFPFVVPSSFPFNLLYSPFINSKKTYNFSICQIKLHIDTSYIAWSVKDSELQLRRSRRGSFALAGRKYLRLIWRHP